MAEAVVGECEMGCYKSNSAQKKEEYFSWGEKLDYNCTKTVTHIDDNAGLRLVCMQFHNYCQTVSLGVKRKGLSLKTWIENQRKAAAAAAAAG